MCCWGFLGTAAWQLPPSCPPEAAAGIDARARVREGRAGAPRRQGSSARFAGPVEARRVDPWAHGPVCAGSALRRLRGRPRRTQPLCLPAATGGAAPLRRRVRRAAAAPAAGSVPVPAAGPAAGPLPAAVVDAAGGSFPTAAPAAVDTTHSPQAPTPAEKGRAGQGRATVRIRQTRADAQGDRTCN